MSNCTEIIVNPEKKNVKYSVEITKRDILSDFKWLLHLLQSMKESCPRIIIFFRQIKQIAEVFEYLQTNLGDMQYAKKLETEKDGYLNRLFAMFHLTTSDKIKRAVCSSFQQETGRIRVVLCSTSFSMGLDVKCVHTVVHYGPANDLDDYLQETGRAGRDPYAFCNAILLKYSRCLSSQNISSEMKNYVSSTSCRRIVLLKPFWPQIDSVKPSHNCCDMCALKCKCLCTCSDVCNCSILCSGSESAILSSIRQCLATENSESSNESSDEEFSSDSDMELFIQRRPRILYDSESDCQ